MVRRAAGVTALFFLLAAPAQAGSLGLAEVRGSDGAMLAKAGAGAYAYPADGSILRIGSSPATAARVELRGVSMFNGRGTLQRVVVPPRGLPGARAGGPVLRRNGHVVRPET